MLKEIVYPTGGNTQFDYESNRYNSAIFEGEPLRENFYYKKEKYDFFGTRIGNGSPAILNQTTIERTFSLAEESSGSLDIKIILPKAVGGFVNGLPSGEYLYIQIQNIKTGEYIEKLELSRLTNHFISIPGTSDPEELKKLSYRSTKSLPKGNYRLKITGHVKSYFDEFDFKYSFVTGKNDYLLNNPFPYAGGLRIKTINSFSNNKIIESTRYEYDDKYSKLVTAYPRYHHFAFSDNDRSVYLSSSGLRSSKTPIGYGYISVYKTQTEQENGKIIYKYRIKSDKQLDYSWRPQGFQSLPSNATLAFDHTPANAPNLSISYADNGILEQELYYNSENHLVKRTTYDYDLTNNGPILWGVMIAPNKKDQTAMSMTYICSLTDMYSPLTAYYHPVINPQWCRLIRRSEEELLSNNFFNTETRYEYNTINKQISKVIIGGYYEPSQITEYTYPCDINTEIGGRLKTSNLVREIMEKKIWRNNILQHIKKDYKVFGNNKIRTHIVKTNTGTSNAIENRLTYHNYDSYGNPVYITKDDATSVVYLWSYNGQYPVAEITNTSYNEVEAALQKQGKTINGLSSMNMPSYDKNILKKDLPNSLITTYTYKPLFGIASMTIPSGLTTYFEYDLFGRLKEEYIMEGNVKKIIQGYLYNNVNK